MTAGAAAGRPGGVAADARAAVRTTEVVPGVWRLCLPMHHHGVLNVNAWALRRDDGLLLVDTGMPGAEPLAVALRQIGATLGDVREVVCTHAHLDHAGGLAGVRDASGADAWLHAGAFGPPAEVPPNRRSLDRAGMPAELVEAVARIDARDDIVDVSDVARPLPDDATFVTEHGAWRVIATPGHDPAHVCLHAAEAGLLISGDQLLAPRQIVLDAGLGAAAMPTMLASLDALLALEARLALPGHGPAIADVPAAAARVRDALGARLERTAAVLAAASAPATPYELLLAVHGAGGPLSADQGRWWLPALECDLLRLEQSGRAERVGGEHGPERWR